LSAAAPAQARVGALPAGLGVGLARLSLAGRSAAPPPAPGPPPFPTARAAALAPDGPSAAPRAAPGAPGRQAAALRLAPAPSGGWGSGAAAAWAPWARDELGAAPAEPGTMGGEHAGSGPGSAMPDVRAAHAGHAELAGGGLASRVLDSQAAEAAGPLGPDELGLWGASSGPTREAASQHEAAGTRHAHSACSAADVFGPLSAESAEGPAPAKTQRQACGQEAAQLRACEAGASDGAAHSQDSQAGREMPGLPAAGTGMLAELGNVQAGTEPAPEPAGSSVDGDALVCAEALSDEAATPHPAGSPAEAATSSAPAADSGEGGARRPRLPVRQSTFVPALAGGARRGSEPDEHAPPASLARPGSGEAAADAEGRCDRAGQAAAAAPEQGLAQSRSSAGEAAGRERRAAPAPSGAGGAAGGVHGAAGPPGAGGSLRARVRPFSQRRASRSLLCLVLVVDSACPRRVTECMWR